MKNIKIFLFTFITVLFFAGITNINAQEKPKEKHNHSVMKTDSTKMDGKKKNPIVREGVIDIASIDKNKNGKVFQDMMCWNVISDEAGDCPLCDMKLKEVTIDKAKTNLKKNGYKFK